MRRRRATGAALETVVVTTMLLVRWRARRRRPPPSAAPSGISWVSSMRSLVMSAPWSSAITTPRCSTITREHSRSSSALSDEHTTVAVPSRRRQVDEAVDVGLRADVDALRRLVEHEHPWRAAEPAGHHDLLLVAARQLADDRLAARRAHVELVDPDLGVLLLGALAQATAATRTAAGRRSSGSRGACSVRNSASLARSAGTAHRPASIAAAGRTAGSSCRRRRPRRRAAGVPTAGWPARRDRSRSDRRCRRPRRGGRRG